MIVPPQNAGGDTDRIGYSSIMLAGTLGRAPSTPCMSGEWRARRSATGSPPLLAQVLVGQIRAHLAQRLEQARAGGI